VAASEDKKIIQFKSDRRTTHESTIHIGREKGRASSVLWEIDSLPIAFHEGDPFRPGHSRVEIEWEKIKSSALELNFCGECWCFVRGAEWSQDELHGGTLTARRSTPST
jgi:hypothetical protein